MDYVFMNFVFFDDVIEYLICVYCVICMEKGYVLLVGVGGSGK